MTEVLFITVFILGVYVLLRPRKTVVIVVKEDKVHEFWDGPVPTEADNEQNLQRIFRIIEKFPNGYIATSNPEYLDEYLKRVELDLPEGVEKSKD